MSGQRIYLDSAAATPVDKTVITEMSSFWQDNFANPSSLTLSAVRARQAIEKARSSIASSLSAKAHQIIFTSGATEANNLVIKGVLEQYPDSKVLISAIEHDSVLKPASRVNHQLISVDNTGVVDIKKLKKLIDDEVVLVSIIHTSNEFGTVQPLSEIAKIIEDICRDRVERGIKRPLLLHSDAAQSPTHLDISVSRLGVDLLTLSAAKIYGPKGIGCLFVRDHRILKPQLLGGGQELGVRSGTEPTALIIGFAKALEITDKKRSQLNKNFENLRENLLALLGDFQPDVELNAAAKNRAPHIISLFVPKVDGERLVLALDQHGIEVATGAACSASHEDPSKAVLALGIGKEHANSTLRISFCRDTTNTDLEKFVKALTAVRELATRRPAK